MRKFIISVLCAICGCIFFNVSGVHAGNVTDYFWSVSAETPASGIEYLRYATGSNSSDTTLVLSSVEYATGDLVLIGVGNSDSSATITGITDNAGTPNTWTVLPHAFDSDIKAAHAYAVIGTGGTLNITITFSANCSADAVVLVFSGSFSNPIDEDISAPASITQESTYSISTSGALDQTVEIVFVTCWQYSGAGTTDHDSGDGFTEVSDLNGLSAQYKITSAADALTVNGSKTNDYYMVILTSYEGS
jgi:hypothetical protein